MKVELRHGPAERAKLDAIRAERGAEPVDVIKALLYRPEFFGGAMSDAFQEVKWRAVALGGPLPS